MFCPECGTKLPFEKAIHGRYPIYDCPKCEVTWVHDGESGQYETYENRSEALGIYGATETDLASTIHPSGPDIGDDDGSTCVH
jgi:Zn-finger nucleic acid-binding protein